MSQPAIELQAEHWHIVRAILQAELPGYEVWAFGSRAQHRAKPYSDLDLAVIGTNALPLELSSRISEAFSESDLPFKVDVVDWATTSEAFRNIIKRDRVIVQDLKVGMP